jgi:hypothetical protein
MKDIESEAIIPDSYTWVGLTRLALAILNSYKKDKFIDIAHPVFIWASHMVEFEFGVTRRTIIKEIIKRNANTESA